MSFRAYAHIFFLLVITLGAVYVIREALSEPFVAWEQYNEVQVANIYNQIDDTAL